MKREEYLCYINVLFTFIALLSIYVISPLGMPLCREARETCMAAIICTVCHTCCACRENAVLCSILLPLSSKHFLIEKHTEHITEKYLSVPVQRGCDCMQK
jgi:hypothetical protein